jgi:predicted ATPase/class 3 adenylate cyclase/DNA-binding CsgD family transcriptional regulator
MGAARDFDLVPASSSLPTGTVTFLLTDIDASAAGWQQAPEVMALAVERYDSLLDQAVAAHGGVRPVEQGDGDARTAAFGRASDAVAAALDAQRRMQVEPWPDGAVLRVRMALHTGEIVVRGESSYAGSTLHRCARLRECAHGGQVVVSRATADLVLDRLPDGAGLVELGPQQLKDLVHPEQVYQLTHSDLVCEFPPLHSLDAHRHNLPYQATPLIGRADELAAIADALEADRVVTLTGSAGIGKTRLAVHTAADRVERHPDGVVFVELATINDPAAVASALAGALRVWETTAEPTVDAITRFVAERSMLVVLDNCEHVIDAAADLANRMLAGCPQVTILATSREPLGVPGEIAWPVPTLPVPAVSERFGLVELSTFDAVRLFGDRARRAAPAFNLTDANAGAVAEICSRLDGIPLALELAAARCRAMTPNQIAGELDRRFTVLTGGARTVLARQQTLLASIEWSHDLLSDDERAAFRRLGVFTGPFPIDAAEAVGGDPGDAGWAVVDVVSRLVDKSLVVHDPDTGWYRMLETIRLYALDRCRATGELEATRDRHATWWTAWLEAHHPDGPSDGDRDAIHHAYPNLRAALQWAAATQPDLALELAGGLGIYWYLQGLLGDAVALGDLALASAERGPAWARAVGRMAIARHYANDEFYMTTIVTDACAIAEASGDRLTPLRSRAARVMSIDNLGELRDLARTADACGDTWVAVRMHMLVAACDLTLDDPEAPVAIDRFTTLAAQIDAGNFRLSVANMVAEQLAADLQVREAIAQLEQPLSLVERASPTTRLSLCCQLAWYGQLCGEPARLERVTRLLARSPRDWGALTPLASAVQRLPELLAGARSWDGPEVAVHWFVPGTLWVLADILGEDRVTLFPLPTGKASGELTQFTTLVMSARSAFRKGRFRDAEDAAATLVRRRAEDRHFWLLMLARCAADAGSSLEAVRLLGAVAGTQERFGLPWLPRVLIAARTETEQLCRAALGDEAFEAAWAEGFELDLDAAVAYALRARGQRKRPSTGWDSLTPTELQVVDQVAAGRTNAEVAAALLMGRTTVKTHLSHIFTKLDLTNRGQLTAEAARRASATPA